MRYLPHTASDVSAMLEAVGVGSVEELFSAVPAARRVRGGLSLPEGLTEWELCRHVEGLAEENGGARCRSFLGAGSYEHHVPAALPYLAGRSEFLTAYTPYQPEVSQGTLQAIFEYQTLVARLVGMEVANASIYDGASSLVEGLLMAIRVKRRSRVAVSRLVHPLYRRVIRTYLEPAGYEVVELGYDASGRTDLTGLEGVEDLAAVAVQSPNFFGCVEDLAAAAEGAHARDALFVASFTEALAYGLLASPGSRDADLVCGEGQSLGIPQSYGGPYLGVFATRRKYVRSMPGRLVGKTVDREGREGYVLTLATREQHIRREKATSNICSNQSLCALTAAMYLATLGKTGIRELARLNRDKAEHLKRGLAGAGLEIPFGSPTFNEFVVRLPDRRVWEDLAAGGVLAGLPLGEHYPELEDGYLLCATETKSRGDLDHLIRGLTP